MGEASGYRDSVRPRRVLDLAYAPRQGSQVLAFLVGIMLFTYVAWSTQSQRVEMHCVRAAPATAPECEIRLTTWPFTSVNRLSLAGNPEAWAQADYSGSGLFRIRLDYPDRAVGVSYDRSGTFEDVTLAATRLNAYIADATQAELRLEYGREPIRLSVVVPALTIALGFLLALVIQRFHRISLIVDANDRYVEIVRRQWPFRTKTEHIPNATLSGARVREVEKDLFVSELQFSSGKVIPIFAPTPGNRPVHERAVRQIERFVAEPVETT